MSVTLHELLSSASWSEVAFALRRYYPEDTKDLEPYRLVFEKLHRMVPDETPFRLVIRPRTPESSEPWKGEPPADVGCTDGSYCELRRDESLCGLDFRRWAECLGMEVPMAARIAYMDAGVVAHCLWEMTWDGFEEGDGQELLAEMERRLDDVREGNFMTWDELKRRLDLDQDAKRAADCSSHEGHAPDDEENGG